MAMGNVPDLGRIAGPKPRLGANVTAFVRRLDDNGTFEGALVRQPDGKMGTRPAREQYVDAEELLEMIRAAVREEVARVLIDSGVVRPPR